MSRGVRKQGMPDDRRPDVLSLRSGGFAIRPHTLAIEGI